MEEHFDLSQLAGEEALLLRRLEDLRRAAEKGGRPRFSVFLHEQECRIAREFVRQQGLGSTMLWGGYNQAARQVFGVFPAYEIPDPALFPITAVTIRLPRGAELSHRDVLGTLMAPRIRRESVGDILFSERRCGVLVLSPAAPVLLGELRKIGGIGVKCEPGNPAEYVREERFQELRGTVSSLRADAVTALLANVSREKAAELIRQEQVRRNYAVCRGPAEHLAPGDVVTVRGYGKYILDETGGPTRKGRLPLRYRKYM